ncbi:MAG TPA: DNA polymerase/3'-5' exonuclease PolX, partial [Candidatus Acidoferrum sp.]|nr:DNA polymerase/3'-5' exonuclease PolX [Candidatus Acidoferrum sp.]
SQPGTHSASRSNPNDFCCFASLTSCSSFISASGVYNLSTMDNKQIARILRETAQLLEIDGAIIGRYRSYEKAAELIDGLPDSIEQLVKEPEKLEELPGIGERMVEHLQEIVKTGDYALRKKLLKKYPATLLDLLQLQSLGPKKVAFLWSNFKAGTVADVEKIAKEGKLRDLPGFGEKSEQNILKAVEVFKKTSGRFHIDTAEAAAAEIIAHIKKAGKAVEDVTPAGSLRRGKETVGDLDLLLTLGAGHTSQKHVDALAKHILEFSGIDQTLAHGENKVSFTLQNGLQVDVRLLEKESFGAALLYFTGSKEHNVSLRGRANDMGLTLNEYALATLKGEKPVARRTEEEIYAKLKLDYIPPELRENTGEIAAAEAHKLPHLIELKDMKGDLQMHTTASDGKNSIEEMAEAARKLGHQYIAITDHSKAVTVANGLDEKRMAAHIKEIHKASDKGLGIRVLAGAEVDIMKEGSLDYSDELLAQLDVVVCSIHSYFNLDRAAMIERMLAAIENPYTQIIAHPTGRLLLRRDPFDYDMEKILEACAKHGVAMECNSYPDRLDLKDVYLRMCKDRGVKVVISTDSHNAGNLAFIRYGVTMARRGWLEKRDVINTLPTEQFLAALRPKPGAEKQKSATPKKSAAKP